MIVLGKRRKNEKAAKTLFTMIETQAVCHKRDAQFNHINNINNFSVNNIILNFFFDPQFKYINFMYLLHQISIILQ